MPTTIDLEKQILEDAATSPVMAIMRLSLEIDRELRKLLAVTGILDRYEAQSLPGAIELLEKHVELPRELGEAVNEFWSLRNIVVHGGGLVERFALRALDYGFRILRLIRTIPRHSYVVVHAGIPVYEDADCNSLRQGVHGVMLETVSPEGQSLRRQVFPTTRTHIPGRNVSWEWNKRRKGWDATWYRDPETNEPKRAWSGALEFVGRELEDV
ncbi:MAG: hypothetical protein ACRD2Y_11025 [Terriglobales bacterium]